MDDYSAPDPPAVAVPSLLRQIEAYALELREIYGSVRSSPAIDSHRARLINFLEKFGEIDTSINDLSMTEDS